eukprot:354169-Chlamydomonas_euryale.AAC.26
MLVTDAWHAMRAAAAWNATLRACARDTSTRNGPASPRPAHTSGFRKAMSAPRADNTHASVRLPV